MEECTAILCMQYCFLRCLSYVVYLCEIFPAKQYYNKKRNLYSVSIFNKKKYATKCVKQHYVSCMKTQSDTNVLWTAQIFYI